MTAVAYSFPVVARTRTGAPKLVLVPEAPSMQAVYRRRRVIAAAVALLVTFAVGVLAHTVIAAVTADAHQPVLVAEVSAPHTTSWEVRPGDTLWSIATATHPGEDPRSVVAQMKAEGISSNLQVGEVVTVP